MFCHKPGIDICSYYINWKVPYKGILPSKLQRLTTFPGIWKVRKESWWPWITWHPFSLSPVDSACATQARVVMQLMVPCKDTTLTSKQGGLFTCKERWPFHSLLLPNPSTTCSNFLSAVRGCKSTVIEKVKQPRWLPWDRLDSQTFLQYRLSHSRQNHEGPGILGHVFKTLEPRAFSSGTACVFVWSLWVSSSDNPDDCRLLFWSRCARTLFIGQVQHFSEAKVVWHSFWQMADESM